MRTHERFCTHATERRPAEAAVRHFPGAAKRSWLRDGDAAALLGFPGVARFDRVLDDLHEIVHLNGLEQITIKRGLVDTAQQHFWFHETGDQNALHRRKFFTAT